MIRIIYITLSLLLCAPAFLSGQELEVSVSNSQVTEGQIFRITYKFNDLYTNFTPPDFSPFKAVSPPSISSSQINIGKQSVASSTVIYSLYAPAVGTFIIPAARVRTSDGKTIKSNTVSITVHKRSSANVPPPFIDETFNEKDIPKENRQIFLRALVDKKEVFIGEPVLLTFRIYEAEHYNYYLEERSPYSPTGFWFEILGRQYFQRFAETIDRVRYRVNDIKMMVLFPQRTGELIIDPFEIRAIRNRSGWSSEYLDLESNPVKITVKKFPEPQPESFRSAIGSYTLNSSIDKIKLPENSSTKLKITINGVGNLKLIEAPQLKFPEEIEAYRPDVKDNIALVPAGHAGTRSWEYLLIPRKGGNYTIPSFSFSFYDSESRDYKTLTTGSYDLEVTPSEGEAEPESSISTDIRFISDEPGTLVKESDLSFSTSRFLLSLAVPALAFMAFILILRRKKRRESDETGLLSRKAFKRALQKIGKAEDFLIDGDQEHFLAKISQVLYSYPAEKFGFSPTFATRDTLRSELERNRISEELINKYLSLLNDTEFARFSNIDKSALNDLSDRTRQLIREIENRR